MAQKMIVDSNIEGMRLDKALSTVLPQSRTQIESFIKDGKITVNNKVVKGSYKLVLNDEILI